ncbi:hypothetical protein ACLMJK_001846 [Lecanora helva]
MGRIHKSAALCALLSIVSSVNAFPSQQPLRSHTEPSVKASSNLPVVVWHGLGDNYQSDGQRYVDELMNKTIGDTYVYHIRLADDPSADSRATFLGDLTHYLEKVCIDLASHPILSKAPAINALGFSQGGQFMRAYVERCNKPRVANLVTFGSQHNGISEFQRCGDNDWLCKSWVGILKSNKWTEFVQRQVVPAQYFRDPEDLEAYLENSNFLADINNEREKKNKTYRENMKKLDRFTMYMFSDDTTVIPPESAYFYEVNPTSKDVTKLQDRELYKEDWIGLKHLDEKEKLEFKVAKGGHMQFADGVLEDCFKKYFKW